MYCPKCATPNTFVLTKTLQLYTCTNLICLFRWVGREIPVTTATPSVTPESSQINEQAFT